MFRCVSVVQFLSINAQGSRIVVQFGFTYRIVADGVVFIVSVLLLCSIE